MTVSALCAWDSHENCNSRVCSCECHVQGREEWKAWQAHAKECGTCSRVVAGLRVGRCSTGDVLVSDFLRVIHLPDRRE